MEDMFNPRRVVRRRKALKLFVWKGFSPDYSSGLAFALAKDEKEARAIIAKEYGREPGCWGDLTVHSVSRKYSAYVCGGS